MKDTTTTSERIARDALAAGERKHPDDPHAAAMHAAVHAAVASSDRTRGAIERDLGMGTDVLQDALSVKPHVELRVSALARMLGDPAVLGERGCAVLRAWVSAIVMDRDEGAGVASAELEACEMIDSVGLMTAAVRRAREADSPGGPRITAAEAKRIRSAGAMVRSETRDVERSADAEAGAMTKGGAR